MIAWILQYKTGEVHTHDDVPVLFSLRRKADDYKKDYLGPGYNSVKVIIEMVPNQLRAIYHNILAYKDQRK